MIPVDLQQQKLLKLISLILMASCSSSYLQQQKLLKLISQQFFLVKNHQSTIVEIIEAYQPIAKEKEQTESTIVEIIEAYQPLPYSSPAYPNLQQQKLLKLISQSVDNQMNTVLSTIVEIIEAYQPEGSALTHTPIYNSRNY